MRKRFTLLTILGSLAVATIFSAVAFSRPAAPAPGASGYHIIKTVPVGGDGGWDYVFVDSAMESPSLPISAAASPATAVRTM